MTDTGYHIVAYTEDQAGPLSQFESGIVQGKYIQLEIIKEHFLSRALVFEHFQALVALSAQQQPVGTIIGAQTLMYINGEQRSVGFALDAKVAPHWRNQGLGRQLARALYHQFFVPTGLTRNCMTAKLGNTPVRRLVSGMLSKTWLYDFVYLTIPSSARVKQFARPGQAAARFQVSLFEPEKLSPGYYTQATSGPGYLHTFQLYRLKIKKVHPAYQQGIRLLRQLQAAKYRNMPREGDTLSFVTLYGHTPDNIGSINRILEEIERKGIGQLLVCCRKGDAIYQSLKGIAINRYHYGLVTDFPVSDSDQVNIDVRCL